MKYDMIEWYPVDDVSRLHKDALGVVFKIREMNKNRTADNPYLMPRRIAIGVAQGQCMLVLDMDKATPISAFIYTSPEQRQAGLLEIYNNINRT